MVEQPAIPGIDPVERELMDPEEYLHETGPITYRAAKGTEQLERCEDCLRVVQQYLAGRRFPRVPGAARLAVAFRTQGGRVVALCRGHRDRRQRKEASNAVG